MEKVDFCTVMSKIIGHCRESVICDKNKDKKYGQFELVVDIFTDHYTSSENISYNSSAVSRWINGERPVPGEIINYYRENGSEGISDSFKNNCLKNIYDLEGLYSELLSLIRNDYTLSEEKKSELSFYGDKANEAETCDFIGMLIFDAIDRHFVPSDKPMLPTSAIIVSECVFGAEVPSPCRYFFGRDTELETFHTEMQEHSKIFIQGFAGIGKSEFSKAYAKKFKNEYRNILYFNYSGSLNELITDMDFIGDSDIDNEQIRFTKHLRFLKSLRTDSLIIIDNFNVMLYNKT